MSTVLPESRQYGAGGAVGRRGGFCDGDAAGGGGVRDGGAGEGGAVVNAFANAVSLLQLRDSVPVIRDGSFIFCSSGLSLLMT